MQRAMVVLCALVGLAGCSPNGPESGSDDPPTAVELVRSGQAAACAHPDTLALLAQQFVLVQEGVLDENNLTLIVAEAATMSRVSCTATLTQSYDISGEDTFRIHYAALAQANLDELAIEWNTAEQEQVRAAFNDAVLSRRQSPRGMVVNPDHPSDEEMWANSPLNPDSPLYACDYTADDFNPQACPSAGEPPCGPDGCEVSPPQAPESDDGD